jgi:epoxyqueuosine reductase
MAGSALTSHDAAARVRAAAHDVGFDAVGIARAEPLAEEFARYEEWIDRGMHGTMGYMARNAEKRRDVAEIVPGARSVIVVARTYDTPARHDDAASGKISRYAFGDDYHDVLPDMLDRLCDVLRTIDPGSVSRRYVDTGPVLEKQWAVRAGLGWQGKHSNILRRDIGSFFFLGVIITTTDLEADTPQTDMCGTCTACLDACPTQAIVEPYVVDGTRCISYWTIETKPDVEIPADIAGHLDGWLFGCDTCQDVCPWNRFRKETTEPRFFPRDGVTVLDPAAVVTLHPDEFSARFRGSPIKRTKLAGLQRNARALLDNTP